MQRIQTKISSMISFIFGEIDFSVFDQAQVITDIIISTIIIFIILKSIKRIHVAHIIFLTILFGIFVFITKTFNFYTSYVLFQGIFILTVISIPLILQKELRQILEQLSNIPALIFKRTTISKKHKLIKSIKQATSILANKRHWALIAIEQTFPLYIYSETGIPLNANISKELILNIFFPKSPLHDGAIIIKNNNIISAGAVLPFTHTQQDYIYWTRHKSALGLSEITDAIIIVVSEERWHISIAYEGKLISEIDENDLEKFLIKNIKW